MSSLAGIVVEVVIQFVQCTVVRRFPVLFDLFIGVSGAALLVAGITGLQAGGFIRGAALVTLGVLGLGFGMLSYRERRRVTAGPGQGAGG